MSHIEKIADESTKIKDVAGNGFNRVVSFFEKIVRMISIGIFKSPPFSLENIFPSVEFFKNKYFKLVSMLIIYLGLMVFVLKAFKPRNTENMIIVYSVCFWIALMAFSIAVVNPYDENSVEYMLKDKVIAKMKEIATEDGAKSSAPELESDGSTPSAPFETKDSTPSAPSETKDSTPSAPNAIKIPESNSVNEEKSFLENTIKSFF